MFGLAADLAEMEALAPHAARLTGLDIVLCPPATLIAQAAWRLKDGVIGLGGQDCAPAPQGPHTGDVSAAMLRDAGAAWVIVGHSERRRDHGESDALVRAKAGAALAAGLTPILCVGETIDERKAGAAASVVARQLAQSVPDSAPGSLAIAYEPVWAIGTGLTPSAVEIVEIHAVVRAALTQRFGAEGAAMRILYGGSVKPANAGEILALEGVDGALVGAASLKAADFGAIMDAHPDARAGN